VSAMRTTLLLCVVASAAFANERFMAAEVVDALQVKDLPASPWSPVWATAHAKTHQCAAQRTVRLNDKNANVEVGHDVVSTLTVRAAYTDSELAVLVEWHDATKSLVSKKETASYGDASAIEFPVGFGGDNRLPHVGMGDDRAPVYVYLQRATDEGTTLSTFVGGGFGSLTRTDKLTAKGGMEYDERRETWRAMFVRPLVDPVGHALDKGLVPVAFALWEGGRQERGGNKYLSSWKFIRLGKFPMDEPFLKRIAWGYGLGELGDPIRGKTLFEVVCTACHWTEQRRTAPVGMAPDLSAIGIYQLPTYIRDSILTPSDVLVHNLQLNRWYNPNGPKDATGAYPNSNAFEWSWVDDKGQRQSKMPSFAGMPPENVADIIAYLKTLDGTIR